MIKVEPNLNFNKEEIDSNDNTMKPTENQLTCEDSESKKQKIFIVPLEILRDKIEYKEKEIANISSDEETETDDEEHKPEEDFNENLEDDEEQVRSNEERKIQKPQVKKKYDNIVIMKVDKEKPGYKCPSCGKLFAGFSSLVDHREFKCKAQFCALCDFRSVGKANLTTHVEMTHGVKNNSKESYKIFPSNN